MSPRITLATAGRVLRQIKRDHRTLALIIVVPPAKPAAVPEQKSSDAVVPMNGSSMCVCGSMPPGITNCPPASTISHRAGASRFSPTPTILPSAHSTSPRNV